jgi:hypothetical protein
MYDRGLTLRTGFAQTRTWLPHVLPIAASGALDGAVRMFERVARQDAADTRRKLVIAA